MKGHLRDVGSRVAAGIEHLRGKVQARRGGRRGAAFFREYRLVSLTVCSIRRSVDVRWQRRLPQTIEYLGQRAGGMKAQNAFTEFTFFDHVSVERIMEQ